MNNKFKKIAITTGDPNGIGAEITIKALKHLKLDRSSFVVISNSDILKFYGCKDINFELIDLDFQKADINPSVLSAKCGDFSFRSLKCACNLAKEKKITAIVTAPVSKEAMHLAGHNFNGQTEVLQTFLAHNNQNAEMLFVAKDFRVLLLTRHIPLKKIQLDKAILTKKIVDTNKFITQKYGISNPNLALCAFNPHAGEGGILGNEEKEILEPMVNDLIKKGISITKPLPADTLFINGVHNYLNNQKMPYDCYFSCYHDQGLIPIKSVGGTDTVNMTIGLDVIRTSPCHGTAFDIAGKNIANCESMISAIKQVL